MPTRTPHYGLTALAPGESAAVDGGKFGGADRVAIDRLLAAAASHRHEGGTRLADPAGPPTLALEEGGTLAAGTTYAYRVAYVDRFGLETAGSAEATVTTAAPPEPPEPPQVVASDTAGTLPAGTYYYGVTAVVNGLETELSAPVLFTLQPDRTAAEIAVTALPEGATGWHVWRQRVDLVSFTRLTATVVPVATQAFLDDGSVIDSLTFDPSIRPPTYDVEIGTNAVRVTLPVADHDRVRAGLNWRVYRTTSPGAYPDEALLAEVVQTVDEIDPASARVVEFVDYGETILLGRPLEISQALTPSARLRSDGIDHDAHTVADELDAIHARLDNPLPIRRTASATFAGPGTISLAPGYRLYTVTTSAAARVRAYTSAAARDADAAREAGTNPAGVPGLVLEVVTTGIGELTLSPLVDGFTADASTAVALTIDAPSPVTVTLLYLPTEG